MSVYVFRGKDALSDTGEAFIIIQADFPSQAQFRLKKHLLEMGRIDLLSVVHHIPSQDSYGLIYSNVDPFANPDQSPKNPFSPGNDVPL